MNPAPVKISRIIRRLSGGSQAQLVQGGDGHFYATKLAGNPQGNRTLINEWVAYRLLSRLDVTTPPLRILELPSSLPPHDDLNFVVGNGRVAPEGVLHLGSQCPVNPEKTAIFDFMPDRLLSNVHNLAEFATMYVFDQWLGQGDLRQAIFVRDKSVAAGPNLKAYFIDHGQAFNGAHWELREMPLRGIAFQSCVYSMLDMNTLVEKAIGQIERLEEQTLFAAMEGVPSRWFAPWDREYLHALLVKLQRRQANLRPIMQRHLPALLDYLSDETERRGSTLSPAV
jgi:hypothetical protein